METYQHLKVSTLLGDKYQEKKRVNPSFSIRAWASSLGLKSHGSLGQILAGNRGLPKKYLPAMINSLGLTKREAKYLETLVDFERAKEQEEKEYFYQKLKESRPKRKDVHILEIENYKFYENPLHSIIRTLMDRPDFSAEPEWIKSQICLDVTINEIKEVMERLVTVGGVKEVNGGLVKEKSAIINKADIPSSGVQEFHRKMCILASEQVKKQHVSQREYNSFSFNIRKDKVNEAKLRLREMMNEFIDEFQAPSQTSNLTYQVNSQFFAINNLNNKENKK